MQLVRPENINRIIEEVLASLNTVRITTSPYHNIKVESFHRTLGEVLANLTRENAENWDLYLTQALATVRFTINETSKFSPYYMLFERDVLLPVDNLLKPRRKYMGGGHHQLIIEQQNRLFT